MVYTRWQDGTHGQAIRDLAIYEKQNLEVFWNLYMAARDLVIYEKQILEGILESLCGHLGFSNLRKAGPLGVFSSLYLAIRDLAIYEKQIL